MLLTAFAIQNAKPKAKPYKLADGGGLHLCIEPHGSELWRFRYHFDSKDIDDDQRPIKLSADDVNPRRLCSLRKPLSGTGEGGNGPITVATIWTDCVNATFQHLRVPLYAVEIIYAIVTGPSSWRRPHLAHLLAFA
jgi:hypothetical protein